MAEAADIGVKAGRWQTAGAPLGLWAGAAALALAGALVDDPYIRHVMILCFLWTVVAAAWDLVLGYAGIFNYAQLVFFAFGAYGSGLLSVKLGVPAVAAILSAGAIAGLVGLAVGLPCLRLRGEYVALFTFAVHLAMPPLLQLAKPLGTGGNTGLLGIPPIDLGIVSIGPQDKLGWYLMALLLATLAVQTIYLGVLRSRTGRAFVALRDSETFARSLGVSDFRYKLLAFVISAVVTGMAGALYAHYTSVVTPKILGNEFFLLAMVMLAIGGIGHFPGAVLGAFIVTIANELLRSAGSYRLLLLGLAVVLTVLYLPNGVVSLWQRLGGWTARARGGSVAGDGDRSRGGST